MRVMVRVQKRKFPERLGEGETYTEIRGGKHRSDWLPMGLEAPAVLLPAKNIKDYDGGLIVGWEGAVTSILEAFDLFYPATLIKLITKKTNQRVEIL